MVQQSPSGNRHRAPRKSLALFDLFRFRNTFVGEISRSGITGKNAWVKVKETVPNRTREGKQFPAIVASSGKTKVTAAAEFCTAGVDLAQKALRSFVSDKRFLTIPTCGLAISYAGIKLFS